MSFDVKRSGPQALLTIVIAIFLLEWVLPEGALTLVKNELTTWLIIVASFTFIVAGITLIVRYARDFIRKRESTWTLFYAVVFFAVFFLYIGVAVVTGGISGDNYTFLFQTVHGSLTQAAWVLMAFLEPWAAYQAFRLRTIESVILAITGFTYILYLAPTIPVMIPGLAAFADWIVTNPAKAGIRGATIAMAVGAMLMALRMLTGKERGIVD